MAGNKANSDYEFSRFRSKNSRLRYDSYSSTAVKLTPATYYEDEGQSRGAGQQKPKNAEERREEKEGQVKIIKVLTIAVILFALFAVMIKCKIVDDDMIEKVASAETRFKTANSENTRLNMSISADSSYDKIEELAENKLGMVKLESSQITYFETTNGDKVIVKKNK